MLKRELPLVRNIEMVEGGTVDKSLPLGRQPHVLDCVEVCGEAEHVLFRTIHWQCQQRSGVDGHSRESRTDDISYDRDTSPIGSENVVTILLVRNERSFRHVYVDVLKEPGTVT